MTREDIEKAASEKSIILAPNNGRFSDMYMRYDFETGFHEGAEWRIESVWHNDLKKGKTQKPILVRFKNGLFNMFEDIRELKEIENEVKIFAYLEDLIPNTEDRS